MKVNQELVDRIVKRAKESNFGLHEPDEHKIKPLDIDALIKNELDNGLTAYKIAKKHGLNRNTVRNHIKRGLK